MPEREASLEILELRKEIERLKKKLFEARTQAPPGTEKLAQGEDHFVFLIVVHPSMMGIPLIGILFLKLIGMMFFTKSLHY